jgi:hypothetical protein
MKHALLSLVALALAAVASAGCNSGAGLCDAVCDCTGDCTDNDRANCYDDYDDAQHHADEEGCGGEFNDYYGCIDGELECRDGRVDADGCAPERKRLDDCMRHHDHDHGPKPAPRPFSL